MTSHDLSSLTPFLTIGGTALVVMLAIAVKRNHMMTVGLTVTGLLLSLCALWNVMQLPPNDVGELLRIDGYSAFFVGLIFKMSIAIALLSYGYWESREGNKEEFYLLLLIATFGAGILVISYHFVSFFLGLEILTVSLYAMIAYSREDRRALEAGMKYLVLAATSSAFLLFGMALIYAELGSMNFDILLPTLADSRNEMSLILMGGVGLMASGVAFKLALVPFHMWTSDVYEGSPAPVTAFIATVSKGAVVAFLLRFFLPIRDAGVGPLWMAFALMAVASMFVGNLLALKQNNVKRLLAYSSIAHFGYLIVAFLAGGDLAIESVSYYLVTYVIAILGAFSVIIVLSTEKGEPENIDDFRGFFWKRPVLSFVFMVMLLSLAGMPLTAGFIGKYLVVSAGVQSSLWNLLILLAINTTISIYYYLRVIVSMYTPAPEPVVQASTPPKITLAAFLILVWTTIGVLYLGLYPTHLFEMIESTVMVVGL